MLRYLPGMDRRGQAYMRMGSFYNGFVALFTLFMVGMTWTSELTVFGILPENGSPIGTITTLVVAWASFCLGNYMPKIKRNYTFGCKTPWALHDESNWRLTHRFCGTAFVISGFATIAGLIRSGMARPRCGFSWGRCLPRASGPTPTAISYSATATSRSAAAEYSPNIRQGADPPPAGPAPLSVSNNYLCDKSMRLLDRDRRIISNDRTCDVGE